MSSSTSQYFDTNDKITLQVGTELFVTTVGTLTSKSGFFKSFLSPFWAKPQVNGSYFLDADPKLLEKILQYLQRQSFPIFYDDAKVHDYAMYVALQKEADYFGLVNLANWLKDKKYLEAVKVSYKIEEFESSTQSIAMLDSNLTNVKLELWPK